MDFQLLISELQFNAYKQRTGHTEEFWGYRVVHDIVEEASIVNEGLRAGLDMIPDIGDPAKGVIVYNSPSVAQADWLAFEGTSNQIIMFRTVRGRALEVKLDSGKVDPSPHHNCHVAFKAPFENDDINPASMVCLLSKCRCLSSSDTGASDGRSVPLRVRRWYGRLLQETLNDPPIRNP